MLQQQLRVKNQGKLSILRPSETKLWLEPTSRAIDTSHAKSGASVSKKSLALDPTTDSGSLGGSESITGGKSSRGTTQATTVTARTTASHNITTKAGNLISKKNKGKCQRTPQSTSHYSRHLRQSPIHPSTQMTTVRPTSPTYVSDLRIRPTCPTYVSDLRVRPTWLAYVSTLRVQLSDHIIILIIYLR